MSTKRLRIAIQKSGRLNKESTELLKQSGLLFVTDERKMWSHVHNLPVDILLVRSCDIPGLVMDNVVDWGIVGENTLEESKLARELAGQNCDFKQLLTLGFGKCHLSIAVPFTMKYQNINDLNGKRIATSYPHILKKFLQQKELQCDYCLLNGSVEVAPSAGLADVICDLVSTGVTLEANGLKEVENLFSSQAVLIQKTHASTPESLSMLILSRISSVLQARESKYIMLHAPAKYLDKIIDLLPCAEHPTILPLAHDDKIVALHVVTRENLFWETMEKLKSMDCSSILVLPVEKMMR